MRGEGLARGYRRTIVGWPILSHTLKTSPTSSVTGIPGLVRWFWYSLKARDEEVRLEAMETLPCKMLDMGF